MTQKSLLTLLIPVFACALVAGCGDSADGDAAEISADEKGAILEGAPASPGAPAKISHRIVGTPVVGQPLQIDLDFESTRGAIAMVVDYRVNDSTALTFPDQQVQQAMVTPDSESMLASQQVTVIPQREGRLYLNVSVGVESDTGMSSTVMAIPIQVGEGPRSFQENGTLSTDADGNPVRVLPASN